MKTTKFNNNATLYDMYNGLIRKVSAKPVSDKAINLKVYHDGTDWRRYSDDAVITFA
jgi:hypothetical protein